MLYYLFKEVKHMDNKQLAHDLAIAKLSGTDLPPEKLVEEYRHIYSEIYDYLSNEPKVQKTRPAKIMGSPV